VNVLPISAIHSQAIDMLCRVGELEHKGAKIQRDQHFRDCDCTSDDLQRPMDLKFFHFAVQPGRKATLKA
jgi:hypothetical protein